MSDCLHEWGYVPGVTPEPSYTVSYSTCLNCGTTGWRPFRGKDLSIRASKKDPPLGPVRWGRYYELRVEEFREADERKEAEEKEWCRLYGSSPL